MNMTRMSISWKLRTRGSCLGRHLPSSYVRLQSGGYLTFGIRVGSAGAVNILRSSESMWIDSGWGKIDHCWRTSCEYN